MTADIHTLDGSPPPRDPPHNIEAEQGVLGAILLNNRAYDNVARVLKPEHFHDELNGKIYAAMSAMIQRGQHVDPVTLNGIASPTYLADLASAAPSVLNAPHYADTIRNYAKAREAIEAGHKLIEAGHGCGHDDDISEVAADSLAAIEAIGAGTEGGFVHFAEAAAAAIQHALDARDGVRPAGVLTGLSELDRLTGGLPRAGVTMIGARTSMGKTALAGSIALDAAKRGVPVAFMSLEMQRHELANRLLAVDSQTSGDTARRGKLDDNDFARYRAARDLLSGIPLEIDDSSALTVEQIMARLRSLYRRDKCALAVIDYLGLIRATNRRDSTIEQIGHITRSLKDFAKRLDIPILLPAQINRGPEARDDKRPQLSDLRSSGDIEQDAECVLLLYRNEYYVARREPTNGSAEEMADWQADMADSRGKAEIIVAKNRHGPANKTVTVAFDGATSGFSDLPTDNEPPPHDGEGMF